MASSDVQLEAINWGRVSLRLTLYAKRRLGKRGTIKDAEDLAMEALTQYLDPGYEWNRDGDLKEVLGSIVNGLIQNHFRRHSVRSERSNEKRMMHAKDHTPSAETRVSNAEEVRTKIDRLLERVADDAVAVSIVWLELDGIDEPREQAQRLKISVQDLYKARRRLKAHTDAINEEVDDQEV